MPSDSFEQLLDRTASWFGIDGGFWDIFGNYHTTSVAAKQAILRALGVAADSAADLEQALGARVQVRMQSPAQFVETFLEGRDINVELRRQTEEREIVDRNGRLHLAAGFAEMRGAHGSARPAGVSVLRQRLGADHG